jgi:hypothetical protein
MFDTSNVTREFPDYDLSTLPAIPADWQDAAWHNDTCPSWQSGNLMIFIDYEKLADREMGIEERYRIADFETSDFYLGTNDWQAVLDYVSNHK